MFAPSVLAVSLVGLCLFFTVRLTWLNYREDRKMEGYEFVAFCALALFVLGAVSGVTLVFVGRAYGM